MSDRHKNKSNIMHLLAEDLHRLGLKVFGAFILDPGLPKTALLIGNAGKALWPAFSCSVEYRDDRPDPLDRWTRRVIDQIAEIHQAKPFYPFEKPYHPFQQWAGQATGMKPSPLGMLISPEFGLWQAFRAVLVFDEETIADFPVTDPQASTNHPCDTCEAKPCMTACPVAAFGGVAFNVVTCRDHLASPRGNPCMQGGCKARNACPVGAQHRYPDEHIRFHMAAFR